MAGLISTLGISTVIDNAIQIWFGTETKAFPNFLDFGKFTIGKTVISWTQIIILTVSLLLMIVFSLIVYKTKAGKSMRPWPECERGPTHGHRREAWSSPPRLS